MNDSERQRLEALIGTTLALRNPVDGSISGENDFRCQRIEYVLSQKTGVPGYDHNTVEKRAFIRRTLNRLAIAGTTNNISFEQFKLEVLNDINSEKKQRYRIVFAVNIEPADLSYLQGFRLGDMKIKVLTFDQMESEFHMSTSLIPLNVPSQYTKNQTSYSYLVLTHSARTVDEAFNKANRQFELARAMINFSLLAFSTSYGTPRQRSILSPSPIMVCFEGTDVVQQYYSIGPFKYEMASIQPPAATESIKILSSLNAAKGALKSRIAAALIVYSEAMDHFDEAYRYLNLYQSLELLLCAAKPGDVASRLKVIFRNADEVHMAIDCLEHKRNLFIHQGRIRDLDQEDANILKHFVDQTIFQLLQYGDALSDDVQFAEFWMVAGDGNAQLEARKKLIDRLLELPYLG